MLEAQRLLTQSEKMFLTPYGMSIQSDTVRDTYPKAAGDTAGEEP